MATYDTRDEAVGRFLRVSGRVGLVAPDDPMVDEAVVDRSTAGEGSGWRLAQDPVTLPGLGHSAHVEDPSAVLALLT